MDWGKVTGALILAIFFVAIYLKDHAVYFKDSGRQRDVKSSVSLFQIAKAKLGFDAFPSFVDTHYFYLATKQYFYSRYVDKACQQILEAKEAFERDESLANLYSLALYKYHIMHNLEKYNKVCFEGYIMKTGNGYLLAPYPVISEDEADLPFNQFFLDFIGEPNFKSSDASIMISFFPNFDNSRAEQQILDIYSKQNQNSQTEIVKVKVTASLTTWNPVDNEKVNSFIYNDFALSDCDVIII